MGGKTIYLTDLALVPLFVLTLFSGLWLHIGGHAGSLGKWHVWIAMHIVAGLLFLLAVLFHVAGHWGWYKSFRKGVGRKSRVTLWLTVAMVPVLLSGLWLVACAGSAGEHVVLLHSKLGGVAGFLAIWHLIVKVPAMLRGLRKVFCPRLQ